MKRLFIIIFFVYELNAMGRTQQFFLHEYAVKHFKAKTKEENKKNNKTEPETEKITSHVPEELERKNKEREKSEKMKIIQKEARNIDITRFEKTDAKAINFQGKELRPIIKKIIEKHLIREQEKCTYCSCIYELAHWFSTNNCTKEAMKKLKKETPDQLWNKINNLIDKIQMGRRFRIQLGNVYLIEFGYPDDGNDYPDILTIDDIAENGRLIRKEIAEINE